jgi:hypothetical protein
VPIKDVSNAPFCNIPNLHFRARDGVNELG